MNSDDLMRRLTASEQKRAALIAQTTKLQMELEKVNKASGGGSPDRSILGPGLGGRRRTIVENQHGGQVDNDGAVHEELNSTKARLAASETQRLQLLRELEIAQEQGNAAQNGQGNKGISITTVPQATDDDFGFDEEEEARLRAEEVMSQLLHSLHSQKEAQQQLSNAQLEITELRSALEASKIREATLSAMVDEYQKTWRTQHDHANSGGNNGLTSSIMDDLSPISKRGGVDDVVDSSKASGGNRESLRVRLLEAKVKELQDECVELRQNLQGHTRQKATNSTDHASRPQGPNQSISAETENQQLIAYMVREQQYTTAVEKLKVMVKEKNAQIKELKNVVRIQLAANSGQQQRGGSGDQSLS